MQAILNKIPEKYRDNAMMTLFGLSQIRMLFFIGPKVLKLDENECKITIPLNWKTKNHLNSMYFGVLAAGADCAGGLIAMKQIQLSGKPISLSFKDFHADFLKRAEGDTVFTCTQGEEINQLVQECIKTGERVNLPVKIIATVPQKLGDEPVAEFILTLSLKLKN